MSLSTSRTSLRGGFTIIELLVAVATLILISLMVARLVDGVTRATGGTQQQLEQDGDARLTLDRIAQDVSSMLVREDINYAFNKVSGNDTFTFLSAVEGYQGTGRPLARVGYRISNHQLERAAIALPWNAGIHYTEPELNDADLTPGDGDFQVLSADVFRLEIAYLVEGTNGLEISTILPDKVSDLRGFIVAIATLDQRSRSLLGADANSTLSDLTTRLWDAPAGAAGDEDVVTPWTEVAGYPISGVPDVVAQNLKVYQRHYLFP